MSFHAKLHQPTMRRPAAESAVRGARPVALVNGLGVLATARIIWHVLAGRREVLVSLSDLPRRIGPFRKRLLAAVDCVLVPPELAGAAASKRLARRIEVLGQVFDRSPFMACTPGRSGPAARRIVYVGELSPNSGVADFLSCAIAWAERNPKIAIEIVWLGEGDLLGVLHAQPEPPNLTQTFADIPPQFELAAMFERCGLLVVPDLAQTRAPFLLEAMAAGLLVLGSVRSAQVRALITQGEIGWLFDPLSPGATHAALDQAFGTRTERLDEMRAGARAAITALSFGHSDHDPAAPLASILARGAAVQA